MKFLLRQLLYCIIKLSFRLRYSVTFKGLENLTKENLHKDGGILFLPNHPSQLDGVMVYWAVSSFSPRPAAVEYLYQMPGVCFLLNLVNAIPVPNIDLCSNNLKRSRVDQVLTTITESLKKKENFLFYPSGRLKLTGVEIIGGASGVHSLLKGAPESNIVLVRINGLWGSSFSRALTGKTPPLVKSLWEGFKHIIKNFIFFTPRRKVTIEFFPNPQDFPYKGSRLAINHYLEDFYNQAPEGETRETIGEPLQLISYSAWKNTLPEIPEESDDSDLVDLDRIPAPIKKDVLKEIANLANKDPAELKPSTNLAKDLGLDSLDATELLIFLEDEYEVTGLYPSDLSTIATVMAIAAKQKVIVHEEEEEADVAVRAWYKKENRPPALIPEGKTIQEVFLKSCRRLGKCMACGDNVGGVLSYKDLKLRAILLAEKIRRIDGDYVGILLPASTAANVVILATLLAGKVPVMINWTVGPLHIKHVIEISKIKKIITSWQVLDRLENTDLGDIDDKIITLEEIRKTITSFDKAFALLRSKMCDRNLLKHFGVDKAEESDHAVVLFTSGTESLPKGVPLTHYNILTNLRAGQEAIQVPFESTLLAVLPPFHSFGFCITGLLPLLLGIRVAYSPDPTNSSALAKSLEKWKISIFCSAPSFLKSLLKVASSEQLKTLQMLVTGAEKTPQDLFEQAKSIGPHLQVLEGYGITECSPILTITRPDSNRLGVGPAVPTVKIIIVHPETHEVLPPQERGLILASGPNIFNGYLDYEGPSPFISLNGEIWYNTGDLGFLDEQRNLHISGRLKRFVKMGGEMISLGAIEDALISSAREKNWPLPEDGSAAFAVCSIERPGDKTQLVLLTRSFLTLRDANDALKEQGLSNLSRLSHIKQVEEIPLTGTGKVNHRLLQEQVTEELAHV